MKKRLFIFMTMLLIHFHGYTQCSMGIQCVNVSPGSTVPFDFSSVILTSDNTVITNDTDPVNGVLHTVKGTNVGKYMVDGICLGIDIVIKDMIYNYTPGAPESGYSSTFTINPDGSLKFSGAVDKLYAFEVQTFVTGTNFPVEVNLVQKVSDIDGDGDWNNDNASDDVNATTFSGNMFTDDYFWASGFDYANVASPSLIYTSNTGGQTYFYSSGSDDGGGGISAVGGVSPGGNSRNVMLLWNYKSIEHFGYYTGSFGDFNIDFTGQTNNMITGCKINVSGTVYDEIGCPDENVNGTGSNTGNTLYAILYDNVTNQVVDVVTVNPDGTYYLQAFHGNAATVYISTINATIGQTSVPAPIPPTGWAFSGEINCGTVAGCSGNDGLPDGILSVGTVTSYITQANFGLTSSSATISGIDINKRSPLIDFSSPGDIINYIITITNTGTTDLTSVVVTDPGATSPPVYSGTDVVLNPGESWIYTAHYVVTQADIDRGYYQNVATVTANDPCGTIVTDNDDEIDAAYPLPEIDIVKTADQATYTTPGQTITYTFTITNTGNVALSNINVTDLSLPIIPIYVSGDDGNNVLNVGEVWIYTATYDINSADISNGSVVNTAQVMGNDPFGNPPVSDTDDELITATPLPVKMLSFEANPEKNIVHLKWATTSENNSDRFEIEHSMDAVHWAPAGVVSASGESSVVMKYSFTHTSPEENINYYRLKIVDLDGTYAYSKPVHAIISESAKPATSIRIYPNPVSDRLYLTGKTSGISSFEILDLNGKKVLAGPYEPSGIKTGGLTEGSYLIRFLKNNNKSETFRIVIRK